MDRREISEELETFRFKDVVNGDAIEVIEYLQSVVNKYNNDYENIEFISDDRNILVVGFRHETMREYNDRMKMEMKNAKKSKEDRRLYYMHDDYINSVMDKK